MLVDLQNMNITGKELEHRLDEVYITVNKNAVPNDPQSPFCYQRRPYRHSCRYQPRSQGGRHEGHRRHDLSGCYRL